MLNTGDPETRARMRAEAKYGFYKHLTAFVVVNLLLLGINLFATPGYFWSVWPLMGWGVAVGLHALSVFVFGEHSVIVDRLTERELRKEHAAHH